MILLRIKPKYKVKIRTFSSHNFIPKWVHIYSWWNLDKAMDCNNVDFLVLILNHSYVRWYRFTKLGEGNMRSRCTIFLQIYVNLYFKIKCKKKKMGLFIHEKVNTTNRKGLTAFLNLIKRLPRALWFYWAIWKYGFLQIIQTTLAESEALAKVLSEVTRSSHEVSVTRQGFIQTWNGSTE